MGLALLVGCGGSSRMVTGSGGHGASAGASGAGGGSGGTGGASAATGGSGGTLAGGSAGDGTGGEAGAGNAAGEGPVLECPPPSPANAPLRHLSNVEYDNTVRDLFGDESGAGSTLPPDVVGFDAEARVVTLEHVETYHRIAHDLAVRLTSDPAELASQIGCDVSIQGEQACRTAVLGPFLSRVLRRPLDEEDATDFASVQAEGERLGGDFASGVRAVIEVALQSPDFLYRIEMGVPDDDRGPSWARPSSYEMATRLSYLLWGSTPDDGLLAAAEADELRNDEAVEAQARRLLADPRARASLERFYSILLPLSGASYPALDSAEHPSFTEDIARLLPQETAAFVADLTFDSGGDFRELLTAPHTWVNGPLAAFYGIPNVTGDELRKVDVDPTQRGGLLTQASIMAATATATVTRPVARGLIVLRRFLCFDLPPPPAHGAVPPPGSPPDDATTRERYAQHSADPACAACHRIIDPLGFAFEHYDSAGLFRDTENGHAIDATGEIFDTDAAGTFDGALELEQRLADSADAARCFQRDWFEFAAGRLSTNADACSLSALDAAFVRTNGNLKELLVALIQTDAFRYRPRSEVF